MPFELSDKRLIFTVSPGCCGAEYLARMLGRLRGVHAVHEGVPSFQPYLLEALYDPPAAGAFWSEQKLPAIAACRGSIYVETTHLFCKGFLEPLLNLGVTPELILISRPAREVALRLAHAECVPTRTDAGRRLLIGPEEPGVIPVIDWQELNDYQLCYWYGLEIERRQAEYRELISAFGGRAYETSFEQVRTASGVRSLMKAMNLPRPGVIGSLLWPLSASAKDQNPKRLIRSLTRKTTLEALEQDVYDRLCPREIPNRHAA